MVYYILKDGYCFTRLSGGLNAPIKAAQEHYDDGDEWWTALQESDSTAAGMALLLSDYPRTYYEKGQHIKRMLEEQHERPVQAARYKLAQFNQACEAVGLDVQAITAQCKSIVLSGDTACGKTSLAMALIENIGSSGVLRINTRDGFKKISASTTGIVIDDMDMTGWMPEELLNVLNPEFDCAVNCRYGDATIPANLPRIFTTNTTLTGRDTFLPAARNTAQEKALERRIHVVRINGPVF